VKILFDANTPAPLARFLRGHEVVRTDELGWQGLENGALLDVAEQAGFDLLPTCDRRPSAQSQHLSPQRLISAQAWKIQGRCRDVVAPPRHRRRTRM